MNEDKREITIETLSTPRARIAPAPLKKRLAASIIDSIVIALAWFLLINSLRQAPATMRSGLYLATASFAYYFLLEWAFSCTLGKGVMKLRVVNREGDPCTLGASFKRNLVRFVDWLPLLYALGGIIMLTSHERQRLGDRVAGTIVTSAPEKDINPPPAPFLFH